MQIISIAEQFNRLKDENEFEILTKIDKKDLKGLNAVRNFIAHDYDSVDDEILEAVSLVTTVPVVTHMRYYCGVGD